MKNKLQNSGIVYSTNPDYKIEAERKQQERLPPAQQKLYVQLSTRHRAGKTVTLVQNFVGTDIDLESLAKSLKTKCGTGGSAKDGEIIIQGDFREKVKKIISEMGMTVKG